MKTKVLLAFAVLIVAGLLVGYAYVSKPSQTESVAAIPTATPAAVQSNTAVPELEKLPDLHLFKTRNAGGEISYYEVKNISADGGRLVLVINNDCNPTDGYCGSPYLYRFLQNGNTYTLLTKYSAATSSVALLVPHTNSIDIPALDIPRQIVIPGTKATLDLENGLYGITPLTEGDLFAPGDKTKIAAVLGYDLYASSTGNMEIYSVRAPDGTGLVYDLTDPFYGQTIGGSEYTLSIRWNGGAQNHHTKYVFDDSNNTYKNYNVCEEGASYVKAISKPISENDLVAVGSDPSGRSVYELKDPNHPALLAAKAQIDHINSYGGTQGTYSPDVILFWKDPFGRMIRFISKDMFEGCGG